jgi:N-acetylneuraminic acid mutarotase
MRSLALAAERLPDMPGIGLAMTYAGASNGAVLVAGGTNFPERKPWEGGKKHWSADVYAWSPGNSSWRVVGQLPRPAAGGACATTSFGVLCAGGGDANQVFADAFLLRFEKAQLVREPLPSLPIALQSCSGVAIGSRVFVLGGLATTDTLAEDPQQLLFSIDLAAPKRAWTTHPPIPGSGRHLPVLATDDHAMFAFSGITRDISSGKPQISYLRDAWKYTPGAKGNAQGTWERLPDLPRSFAAGPTPAPVLGASAVFLGGGVDAPDIVAPMDKRGDLNADIVAYDLATGAARRIGAVPVSVVVATAVPWRDGSVIVPSGEIRAGIRSPQVWLYRP